MENSNYDVDKFKKSIAEFCRKKKLEKAKKEEYEKIVDFTMNCDFEKLECRIDDAPGGAEMSVACHLADLVDVRSNSKVCMMTAFHSLAEKLVKADPSGMALVAFDLINASLRASENAMKNGVTEVTEEAILREVAKITAERNRILNSAKPKP